MAGLRANFPCSLAKEAVVGEGKHRVTHPPVESLICRGWVAAVVVVSLVPLIGFLCPPSSVELTFPDPLIGRSS